VLQPGVVLFDQLSDEAKSRATHDFIDLLTTLITSSLY